MSTDITLQTPAHQRWIFLVIQELWFLDYFFILVQLYSNQGVSCRNIGQEQLRVTQSMEKGDSNGPLYHGKESKMMLYIADLARSFSIVHRKLFWGARAEILLLCAEILPFWASCRNITVQEPRLPGNPCRAIFGHVQKYWFLEEIFTSAPRPSRTTFSRKVNGKKLMERGRGYSPPP